MLLFKWFSVLALAAVAYAEGQERPTELIIDTTYMPPECPIKSDKGDSLSVHYVN
jgi:FK506-binding protein 2